MGAQVISLFQRPAPLRDWSQQELAEFYRVENALLQAGMRIETERGMTDDGEPWFAFCRADDGEVFIHFARIGGRYIIAGEAFGGVIEGWDFASLVRELIDRHPLVQLGPARRPSNVFMHPAALLIAIVGTAFFKTSEAKADDGGERHDGGRRLMLSSSASGSAAIVGSSSIAVDANQTMTLVAAAMAAVSHDVMLAQSPSETQWRLLDDRALFSASPAAIAGAPAAPAPLPTAGTQAISGPAADLSDWVALTTVLTDLAGMGVVSEMPPLLAQPTDLGDLADLRATDPGVADAAPQIASSSSIMVVELAAGPLPDVSSVRLARDLGALDGAQVIRVAELPQFLADFLANGRQVEVTDTPAPAPAESQAPAPEPSEPASGVPEAPVDQDPGIHVPAPVAQPPHVGELFMSSSEVSDLVGRFVNSTPFSIISHGDDLIFYDRRIQDL
ncbi:MAG TPA: hypothetical protein VEA60_12925, partial [Allosphingosinicella sp.]|nr:hypothetical protein [Allosphingosinicella sp.]